ncbi:MAG: ABC transporter ATP-binding protein [Betaproteobacteria bacterium]
MFRFFESLLNAYPEQHPKPPPAQFVRFLWEVSEGVRGYMLAVTLLTAAIGAFEAILFALIGELVDWLAKGPSESFWQDHAGALLGLAALLLGSISLVCLQALFKYQSLYGNFPMRLRWNFHRLMLSQSMGFYQDEFAGRIATKVMQTALAVRDVLISVCDIMVFVVIYFVTMVAVLGSFDPHMLLPFIGWVAAYMLALRFFVPRIGKVGKLQADARSLMTGRITDAYTNIATVKLFSHADREADYAKRAMSEFMQTAYAQMRLASGFEMINHVLSMLLILLTSATVLHLWVHGEVGAGAVAAATAMALRLNGISHWVMWELAGLFENIGTVRDGMNMLSKRQSVVDADHASELVVTNGEIVFSKVCFSYDGQRSIIDDLNLRIAAGEKIGLVGPSGAGKSTVTNLLLRFYDLQSGSIRIDDQDIAQVKQTSLRQQIGMVTQDTSLLHRSVRDNLLYGNPQASEAMMRHAAQRAQAETFIDNLTDPAGRKAYEAHVGERGVKLSGGQRQRVAIARVMIKNAPILILDEATSALDSEIEAAIQQSLNQLMQGKTVLAIAHRLSTIAAMDRLIVMDGGRIVEEGSHQDLLAQNGLYARLWAHQSGGFLGTD